MNLKNMTADEIRLNIDIDEISYNFIQRLTYHHPEIVKYEGQLNEYLMEYRKNYRWYYQTKIPRSKKIAQDKMFGYMFAWYNVITNALAKDIVNR